MGDRIDKTQTEEQEPFERATGQVERSTQDLSEREQTKSRQADPTQLAPGEPDAEGVALPGRQSDPDEGRSDHDDGSDAADRAAEAAKPFTVHDSE